MSFSVVNGWRKLVRDATDGLEFLGEIRWFDERGRSEMGGRLGRFEWDFDSDWLLFVDNV